MKYFVPIFVLLLVVAMVPANAGWLFEYNVNYTGTNVGFLSSTSGVGHSRSGAVIGEDSFFFINSGRPTVANGNYNGLIYNNCTGATDIPIITPAVWVNPADAGDTITTSWCWGVAYDAASGSLLLANQDIEYSVLAFDLAGAPTINRNELGFVPRGGYYPTDMDTDATGNIYVANYGEPFINEATPLTGNVGVWAAISSDPDWATGGASPHNPAFLAYASPAGPGATDSEYSGYGWVCEGVGVSADGTVIAQTQRSGGKEGIYVSTGSPSAGYVFTASTPLTAYALSVGGPPVSWSIRGCDVAPDGQHVFVVMEEGNQNSGTDQDYIVIWDWTTGVFRDVIFIATGDRTVTKRPSNADVVDIPYDVDVYEDDIGSPFALNVLVSPYFRWQQASKYTGNLTTDVNDWSLY